MCKNDIKKCCSFPYSYLEIQLEGDCFFCCPSYVKDYISIGNIFEQDFDDIWYGEKAIEFRKSILDGSYSKCNLKICPEKKNQERDFLEEDYLNPPYPENVVLSYLSACNVRCVTCRDHLFFESKENTEYFNRFIDNITKVCKRCKNVKLNGAGEIFVSKHLKKLINEIIKVNPDVKFNLLSNGLLFDEAHLKEFNLLNRVGSVYISIHAASKKTYEKIVRGGKWDVLQKNLAYISKMKKEGKIDYVSCNFVVHSLNYKEMPKFVKMAKKFGIIPSFWRFRKWGDGTEMSRNYEKYTVWEKDHKDYKKFLKVFKKLKGMDTEIGWIDPLFQSLYNKARKTWFDKVIKKFKFN